MGEHLVCTARRRPTHHLGYVFVDGGHSCLVSQDRRTGEDKEFLVTVVKDFSFDSMILTSTSETIRRETESSPIYVRVHLDGSEVTIS
jgi:hypothetical protein